MSDLSDSLYQKYSGSYSGLPVTGRKKKTDEEKKNASSPLKDYVYSKLGFASGTDPGEALKAQIFGSLLGTTNAGAGTTGATGTTAGATVQDQPYSAYGYASGNGTDLADTLQSYMLGTANATDEDTRAARVSAIKSLLGYGS